MLKAWLKSSEISRKRTCEPVEQVVVAAVAVHHASSSATSSKSRLSALSELSKISLTDARPARGVALEPFHIKSSPRLPRILFIDCSPSTKRKDSAMLLLPEPLGPTTEVMAEPNSSWVFFAKDFKPRQFDRLEPHSSEYIKKILSTTQLLALGRCLYTI